MLSRIEIHHQLIKKEWAKRIQKIVQKQKIETVIIVGNHDRSASMVHANVMEVYDTLNIPYIHVCGEIQILGPEELNGLEVQVVAIPWLMREDLLISLEMTHEEVRSNEAKVYQDLLQATVDDLLASGDDSLPTILTAHGTVESAIFGEEKNISIGGEFILPNFFIE